MRCEVAQGVTCRESCTGESNRRTGSVSMGFLQARDADAVWCLCFFDKHLASRATRIISPWRRPSTLSRALALPPTCSRPCALYHRLTPKCKTCDVACMSGHTLSLFPIMHAAVATATAVPTTRAYAGRVSLKTRHEKRCRHGIATVRTTPKRQTVEPSTKHRGGPSGDRDSPSRISIDPSGRYRRHLVP